MKKVLFLALALGSFTFSSCDSSCTSIRARTRGSSSDASRATKPGVALEQVGQFVGSQPTWFHFHAVRLQAVGWASPANASRAFWPAGSPGGALHGPPRRGRGTRVADLRICPLSITELPQVLSGVMGLL